jgi:hypothetical protein
MTRAELITILIGQARENGFEFRRWYTSRLGLPWINAAAAITILETQQRYYALLFSHEFAHAFWKPGSIFMFRLPPRSFERVMRDGSTRTLHRKSFMKRTAGRDAWRYHLREMAAAEEPLRYMQRYLTVEEELEPEPPPQPVKPEPPPPPDRPRSTVPRALQMARSAAERRAEHLRTTGKKLKPGRPKGP